MNSPDHPSVSTSIRGQGDLVDEVIASFPEKGKIIDIGTGSGLAARRFSEAGWDVVASGYDIGAYLSEDDPLPENIEVLENLDICDMKTIPTASMDAVWCAHVLEHVLDTARALAEIRRILKPEGWLFVAVPPFKHAVVGGHVHPGWNVGILMYVLADAGFGLAEGRFVQHGYNVFGMVQRGPGPLPEGQLRRANGDLEILREAGRFPKSFGAKQGFSGSIRAVNWKWTKAPMQVPTARAMLASPPPISKIKIGFFVPWITKGRGGTENVGQMMANAMARRGHQVVVFTFEDGNRPSRWPLDEEIELVCLPEADTPAADQQMLLEVASRSLDLLVGLHMNRTMLRYVRCAHKAQLPIVLSEHVDPRLPARLNTFTPMERQTAFFGATSIHLLTEAFRRDLPPSVIARARVIPNTVPSPTDLAAPGCEGARLKRLVTVARLVPNKRIATLVKAFAQVAGAHRDWRLQIIGNGPERRPLEALVRASGIKRAVEFVGEVDDTYPYYAQAELFVLPSRFEGFPMSCLEAMAHGLPLIGFAECIGVNEQIIPERNGLLCSEHQATDSLATALDRLMSDAELRKRMGATSRKRFLTQYSEEIIFDRWEELFAEAVEQGLPNVTPTPQELLKVRLAEAVAGTNTSIDDSFGLE